MFWSDRGGAGEGAGGGGVPMVNDHRGSRDPVDHPQCTDSPDE